MARHLRTIAIVSQLLKPILEYLCLKSSTNRVIDSIRVHKLGKVDFIKFNNPPNED